MHPQSTLVQLPLWPTEKRCATCGIVKPLEDFWRKASAQSGRRSQCKDCQRAAYRRWRASRPTVSKDHYWADPGRYRAYARAARQRDPQRHHASVRASCERYPERVALRRRRWRQTHAAHRRAYDAQYRLDHREQRALRLQAWKVRHPLSVRRHLLVRRARRAGAAGHFSIHDLRMLYEGQDGRCYYCGDALAGVFVVDHKTPLSRGGSNWPSNLALTCWDDNARKFVKTEQEYRALLARQFSNGLLER